MCGNFPKFTSQQEQPVRLLFNLFPLQRLLQMAEPLLSPSLYFLPGAPADNWSGLACWMHQPAQLRGASRYLWPYHPCYLIEPHHSVRQASDGTGLREPLPSFTWHVPTYVGQIRKSQRSLHPQAPPNTTAHPEIQGLGAMSPLPWHLIPEGTLARCL